MTTSVKTSMEVRDEKGVCSGTRNPSLAAWEFRCGLIMPDKVARSFAGPAIPFRLHQLWHEVLEIPMPGACEHTNLKRSDTYHVECLECKRDFPVTFPLEASRSA